MDISFAVNMYMLMKTSMRACISIIIGMNISMSIGMSIYKGIGISISKRIRIR